MSELMVSDESLFINHDEMKARRFGRNQDEWAYIYVSYTRRYIRLVAQPLFGCNVPRVKLTHKSRIGHAAAMEWATNYARAHRYKIYVDDPVMSKMVDYGYMLAVTGAA